MGSSVLGLLLTLTFVSSAVRSDLRGVCLGRTTLFTSGEPAAPATLNFLTASATLLVVVLLGRRMCTSDRLCTCMQIWSAVYNCRPLWSCNLPQRAYLADYTVIQTAPHIVYMYINVDAHEYTSSRSHEA